MSAFETRPVNGLRIVALETVPEAVGQIVQWFESEWPDWYGPDGPGNPASDLQQCLHSRRILPRCLIAVDNVSRPVGTVSLRDTSPGSDRYPGVWLTALLVPQPRRQSGIGGMLVSAAEREADRLGFDEIHATTGSVQSLLVRRGWKLHDTLKEDPGMLQIFRKSLKQSS
ncbi:GNAT family N-acetyltransferase [Roseibium album]|uniref:GNAT family N-acetyltransferase n=1 Tax=Roseibium album TaxID=311410 RepID=UPI00391A036B